MFMKQPSRRSSATRSAGRQRFVRTFDRDSDPYHARGKIKGAAQCPDCGAVWFRNRWSWRAAPATAKAHRCPACQRVHDKVPAAYLTLRGRYVRANEKEILRLVRNVEARERKEHALKRLMNTERRQDDIVLTFTDSHLARAVGEALHHAHHGKLVLEYTKQDVMLRATWSRND
jgi:NMD protein affecting ribosome stability and mRNA decay